MCSMQPESIIHSPSIPLLPAMLAMCMCSSLISLLAKCLMKRWYCSLVCPNIGLELDSLQASFGLIFSPFFPSHHFGCPTSLKQPSHLWPFLPQKVQFSFSMVSLLSLTLLEEFLSLGLKGFASHFWKALNAEDSGGVILSIEMALCLSCSTTNW